jgi:hypothetical protein
VALPPALWSPAPERACSASVGVQCSGGFRLIGMQDVSVLRDWSGACLLMRCRLIDRSVDVTLVPVPLLPFFSSLFDFLGAWKSEWE